MALLRKLSETRDEEELQLYLFVLLEQGELVSQLPLGVQLLNKSFCKESVLTKKGRRALARTSLSGFFRGGGFFRKMAYTVRTLAGMLRRGRVQTDKLLWRVISDSAPRLDMEFDLAVAYIEGGSAYYTADHVKAKTKAAFVHIDYPSAGYTRDMDQGCWAGFQKIFTVSGETAQAFIQFYPEYADRVEVFPNFVDQQLIRVRSREPGGFSDGYKGLRLLTAGRLTHQKGLEVSVEAMGLLKDWGVAARWYVLGEGDRRRALEAKIAALGLQNDFVLLGAVENPYPYYAQAQVYVHATRFEGRSIAIQEAMTLGLPVVASDRSGNREQLEPGVDGLLCPLEPHAIAKTLRDLLADEERRRALGAAAAGRQTGDGQERRILRLLEDRKDGEGIADHYSSL